MSRNFGFSNPRKQMLYEKEKQVSALYEFAADREDETLLNGNSFIKSPRIFDRKFVDNIHHKITVETIEKDDWIECGDYLQYDGMTWLCLNSYSFHKLYCKATFMSCDWKLYWQSETGEIRSMYVVDQNSTQYNSGESGNSTVTIGAAQHMLKMQCTDTTVLFDSPMRFAIDKNIKSPTCYKVTQNDNSSYNYGKGLCCVTVTEDRRNNETDKLVTLDNGTQVWICDYSSSLLPDKPPDETEDSNVLIIGTTKLKCGYSREYTAKVTDSNGDEIHDCILNWNIISEFKILQETKDNTITLTVNDEDSIGSSFLLQVTANEVTAEIEIFIIEAF